MQQVIISLIGGMALAYVMLIPTVQETKSKLNSQDLAIAKCEVELTEIKAINQGMMLNK